MTVPVQVGDGTIVPIIDEGLGNSAYLIDLGDGRALAVDPSRDLRAVDASAHRSGLKIAFVAETHLHADFVSGATRLAARDGATVLGSATGNREFPHRGLADGDEMDLGGYTLHTWTTPGHTFEHLAYLLRDGNQVRAVFTGGSLLVGAAARTDLSGAERTEDLARAQFHSLRRLAELPDGTPVYPTHGVGSFCSAPPGADRATTIGREKATNPLLRAATEDEFVRALLDSLGSYPPYFLWLGEVNRRGPSLAGTAELLAVSVAELLAARQAGAEIIDVRPVPDYAAAHIPGSLSIALRPAFASWLGWLVPDPATPIIVLRNADQDPQEILWQARKIGYDHLASELSGGITTWRAAGQPVRSTPLVTAAGLDPRHTLDVRQRSEFATGHVPVAAHIELGSLAGAPTPAGTLVAMCGHGERAASAASVLERSGRTGVGVLVGGPDDWAAAAGQPLEEGG